jgi:hypothetical protein
VLSWINTLLPTGIKINFNNKADLVYPWDTVHIVDWNIYLNKGLKGEKIIWNINSPIVNKEKKQDRIIEVEVLERETLKSIVESLWLEMNEVWDIESFKIKEWDKLKFNLDKLSFFINDTFIWNYFYKISSNKEIENNDIITRMLEPYEKGWIEKLISSISKDNSVSNLINLGPISNQLKIYNIDSSILKEYLINHLWTNFKENIDNFINKIDYYTSFIKENKDPSISNNV